jgi:hypothetical protein
VKCSGAPQPGIGQAEGIPIQNDAASMISFCAEAPVDSGVSTSIVTVGLS